MDEASICLKPFWIDEIEYIKGWDGFISPEGFFLKVIERNKYTSAHDCFVKTYCDIVLNRDFQKEYHDKFGINLGYKDLFINVLEFVNYEYNGKEIKITPPNYLINGHSITDKQIEMIIELCKINDDIITNNLFEYDKKINNHELFLVKNNYILSFGKNFC